MFIVYSQIVKGFKLRPSLSKETFPEFFRNFFGIYPEKFRDFTFPEKLQPYATVYVHSTLFQTPDFRGNATDAARHYRRAIICLATKITQR